MDAPTIHPFNTEHAVGARCRLGKTFTDVDNALIAGVTGNLSPAYMDALHCRELGLGGRLLFEVLIAGLACSAAAELVGGGFSLEKLEIGLASPPMLGATYHAEAVMDAKGADGCDVSATVVDAERSEPVAEVRLRYKRL
jgi:acyl dehydratase